MTDQQLLREYAERVSEEAFGELVRRHVDLVYSAALRMVREHSLAEDVTQGVFVALAGSAAHVAARPVLAGWLHRTAQNLAANALRSAVRRRAREQEAAAMTDVFSAEPNRAWEEIAPQLDAALGDLNEPERDALLLRYFEKKSAREMAEALGTSEEAAQKRVSRAVEHLREFLAKRGVTAGSGLAVLLSVHAVHSAPVGLALSVTTSASLVGTAGALAATSTAAKTIAMTTLQKAAVATALAVAVGLGTYEARQAARLRDQVSALQKQAVPTPEGSNGVAPAALDEKLGRLEAENKHLKGELVEASAAKARVEVEREQARHSAALFKEMADQAHARDRNPTNGYPSPRYVMAAFGRLARFSAGAVKDESKLSREEKSALDTARMDALSELPNLVKAMKRFDAEKAASSNSTEDSADQFTCLLYGALNLDEQQFGEVYGLSQKYAQEAKEKNLMKGDGDPSPETEAATKRLLEQAKADIQTILTPEQSNIFDSVMQSIQITPGNFNFNFKF